MQEAFEKLKTKIGARKETVLPERNYMFGKLGVVSAEATNRTIDAVLSIVSEVEAEYINKSTEHINKLRDCSTNWIPCSERLPEEATVYEVTEEIIICSQKQYIVEHCLFGTEGEWLCPSNRKVIAWMPLPEPYKPEK